MTDIQQIKRRREAKEKIRQQLLKETKVNKLKEDKPSYKPKKEVKEETLDTNESDM